MTTFQDNKIITMPGANNVLLPVRVAAPIERPEHIKLLLDMLSFRRPNGSKTERKFIHRYLAPLGCQIDAYGNYYKRIGDAPIMWSCHTDTVHGKGGRQRLKIVSDHVLISDKNSDCLGADCTAGVWLMTEMIKAEIPGLYIFHRAEEVGGKGSNFISYKTPELVEGIKFAIAFDRRGRTSVITHQWGGRCCSDAFSHSLSEALGLDHIPDDGGSFTDTANYVDIIGECTNLSVGYYNEHSVKEILDLGYIARLRDALIAADFTTLVEERKAGDVDYGDWGDDWKDYNPTSGMSTSSSGYTRISTEMGGWPYVGDQDQTPQGFRRGGRTMYSLVRDHPEEVADYLEEGGISPDELAYVIYMRGGVLRK